MKAPRTNGRRALLKAAAFALENQGQAGLSRVEADALEDWLRHELPAATNGETLRYWRMKQPVSA